MAIGTGAALIGSAVIGAGSSIFGASKAAKASKKAAKLANDVQWNMFLEQQKMAAPTMRIGYQAQKQIAQLYGLNPDEALPWEQGQAPKGAGATALGPGYFKGQPPGHVSTGITLAPGSTLAGTNPAAASSDPRLKNFFTSPGYMFRVGEGIKALDRSAAARGRVMSGRQIKGAQEFGQQLGTDEYGNWLAGLQSLAGQGISSTDANRRAALATGEGIAGNYLTSGAARASAYQSGAAGVNEALQGSIANYLYARGRGLI